MIKNDRSLQTQLHGAGKLWTHTNMPILF